MNDARKAELIQCLRRDLDLPPHVVSAEELLAQTEGTFTRARIEFGLAIRAFVRALRQSVGLRRS